MSLFGIRKAVRFAFLTLALSLFASAAAYPQEATATLGGAVKDRSGGVIPSAKVTLTNSQTGIARETRTNLDGAFLFSLLPIGTYNLTAEAPSFRKYVHSGIVLNINQNARQDIELDVGAITQVVEVTGNVSQVDTVSATLGEVETERRILDLPLVGRDTLQLGLLQAGVFAPDPDDGSGNPFSVSGQRSESMTFLLDGADNTDFLGNNIVISPNPDAVAEFKIITNNYEAEYGRTSGGIINQVIKSGANEFNGDVFEFLRNNALNARDFFLPDVTPFKRNVFGGTLGGPIKRDKTFFFGSYQGTRRREGQVAPIQTVLSTPERSGDFSDLLASGIQLVNPITGNNYTVNQVPVDPISANYISKCMPMPNIGTNEFVAAPVASIHDDQMIYRVDHNFNQKDTLSGVYLFDGGEDYYPFQIFNGASTGGDVPNGSAFTDTDRYQSGSITWTHSFGPTMINEARFAANRVATFMDIPVDHTTPQELGFTNVDSDDPGGTAPPLFTISGSVNMGPSPDGPTKIHDAVMQGQDTLSWTRGRHALKFGADYRRVRDNFHYDFFNNGSFDFATYGSFTGYPLADFVGGFPDNFYQTASALYGIRESSIYFFAQDSWKVTSRFSLDVGLRYEYNTPQVDPHNELIGYFPNSQSTVFPNAPPGVLYVGDPGTPNHGLLYPDHRDFAPRFGLAWDMFGNGRLVMRGGYGIFYDIEDGALNLQFGGQAPFGDVSNLYPAASEFTSGVSYLADPFTPLGYINPFPFAASGRVGEFFDPKISFAYVIDPRFRTPYTQDVNYGFQLQITPNTMLQTVYVGSFGRKLVSATYLNNADPSEEMRELGILEQQSPGTPYATLASEYDIIDCSRPLSGCYGPNDPATASYTDIGQLNTNLSNGTSNSNEMQVTLDKRMSHTFETRVAYTLSKTTDLTSGFRARSSTYTDPFDYRLDHSLADFDATHRLVISGLWELPFDHGVQGNHLLEKLAGGWSFDPIVMFQSGNPYTLYAEDNSSLQNIGLDRPDVLGPVKVFHNPRQVQSFTPSSDGIHGDCLGGAESGNFAFDPTNLDCVNVPLFTYGTMGRNTLRSPGINNWEFSILKDTNITERQRVEFRAEFFNAFNHAQFSRPDNDAFSSTFGQVVSTRGLDSDTTTGARIVQFAIKYYF